MKKYIKPQMTQIVINNETIMAGSITTKNIKGNGVVLSKESTGDEWDFGENED